MTVIAAVAALYSINYVLDGNVPFLTKKIGAWQTWRQAGLASSDPYTRNYFIDKKRLPLSRFEMVEFRASEDDAGRRLNPNCIYVLQGNMPVSRRWSLIASPVVATNEDTPQTGDQLLSEHAIFNGNNELQVILSPEVRPGNWIETDRNTEYELFMQIYNPAYSAGRNEYTSPILTVNRQKCL